MDDALVGLIILSHGQLARELLAATEHVVGKTQSVLALGISSDADMDEQRTRIAQAIKKLDAGKGVIITTDMFGGTPSNLAISFLDKAKVEVVSGVNLPMLIKLANARQDITLKETAAMAVEAGCNYIRTASTLLESS